MHALFFSRRTGRSSQEEDLPDPLVRGVCSLRVLGAC